MSGKRVLITAGPTFEAIDPVRGITNLSSGKMGYALARACRHAGAQVTLVSGPTALATPAGVSSGSTSRAPPQMMAAVDAELTWRHRRSGSTASSRVAAVADWRVAEPAASKIKKQPDAAEPPGRFEAPETASSLNSSRIPTSSRSVARRAARSVLRRLCRRIGGPVAACAAQAPAQEHAADRRQLGPRDLRQRRQRADADRRDRRHIAAGAPRRSKLATPLVAEIARPTCPQRR